MESHKIAILPMGFPIGKEDRAQLTRLLNICGIGLGKFIDRPMKVPAAYADELGRRSDVSSATQKSNPRSLHVAWVITSENDFKAFLGVRRTLERAFTPLIRAVWLMYVVGDRGSNINSEVQMILKLMCSYGTLNDDLDTAPLWRGPDDGHYILLTRRTTDLQRLVHHVNLLWGYIEARDQGLKDSRFLRRTSNTDLPAVGRKDSVKPK